MAPNRKYWHQNSNHWHVATRPGGECSPVTGIPACTHGQGVLSLLYTGRDDAIAAFPNHFSISSSTRSVPMICWHTPSTPLHDHQGHLRITYGVPGVAGSGARELSRGDRRRTSVAGRAPGNRHSRQRERPSFALPGRVMLSPGSIIAGRKSSSFGIQCERTRPALPNSRRRWWPRILIAAAVPRLSSKRARGM